MVLELMDKNMYEHIKGITVMFYLLIQLLIYYFVYCFDK